MYRIGWNPALHYQYPWYPKELRFGASHYCHGRLFGRRLFRLEVQGTLGDASEGVLRVNYLK